MTDDFVERIHPDAFSRALRERDDVRALFNHDSNQILGRSGAGTMQLSIDRAGLRYDIDLPDTDIGRRVATAVERGDVSGSSFSFRVLKQRMFKTSNLNVRELQDVQIVDVGPVTYPAYAGTTAAIGHGNDLGRKRRMRQLDCLPTTKDGGRSTGGSDHNTTLAIQH